jgi:hypothetical protein
MIRPVQFVCNFVVPTLVAISAIAADSARIPYAYGILTDDQAVSVLYLQWPQSYGAIKNLLGSPQQRSEASDWYLRRGGAVRIDYDKQGTAIGYRWEEY